MKAEAKSLRFLGEGKKLKVPFFQRRYVWEKENWEELLHTFLQKDVKPFLGSLIIKHITQADDYIIDGQQRLTTVTILAKAIYDSLTEDREHSGIRREIENFLFYKDNSADDFRDSHVKIEHSRLDFEDYEKVIKAGLIDGNKDIKLDDIVEESSKIFRCYKYYREQLQSFSTDNLKELFNSLFNEDRKVFVLIELEYGDVNEQSIFDTINRAGIHLNAADIIKNNLFKRLIDYCSNEYEKEKVVEIYSQNWDSIFISDLPTLSLWDEKRTFGNIQHTNLEFLLYCVACIKWGEDKDMFPNLAEVFDKQTEKMEKYELIDLISDIKRYAEIFKEYILDLRVKLEDEECDVYFKYDNYIDRLLFILQKFKVQMFYPYVLKRLYETNANSNDETLKHDFLVLESFVMRRKISSRGTHDYTTKCYEIINHEVEKLFESNETDITDLEIYRALSKTKDDTASMILFWIELYRRKVKNYDVSSLEYSFTLEHIMPKAWAKHWSDVKIYNNGVELDVNSDDGKLYRNDHIQSIGNKTLITSSLNSSVKNACFKEKINGNGNSLGYNNHTGLMITKEIVDNFKTDQIWDEEHIESRQNKLFNEFKEIWPYFKNDTSSNEIESADNQTMPNEEEIHETSIDDYESDIFDDANKLLDAVSTQQTNTNSDCTKCDTSLKRRFIDEIKDGKMNFSYKPVFIKALFDRSDKNGSSSIYDIAVYFINFYNDRKVRGLVVENPKSIMCKNDFTVDDVINTIKRYPLYIYKSTQTVDFNDDTLAISIVKDVWNCLSETEKKELSLICDKRIESYYKSL